MAYNSDYRFDPLSEKIDLVWSGNADPNSKKFSNYYDYFFSGEDIKVYIDGLFDQEDELDIASFAFIVRQEKQPLYGFWSYNYDAMLYGTRLITGEFSVYTRYPRRMTDLIEKATEKRVSNPDPRSQNADIRSTLRSINSSSDQAKLRSLKDEKNIQKYWSYSQLDRITTDPFSSNIIDSNKNIFSAHPPFNFIIMHGIEEVSLSPKNFLNSEEKTIEDNLDRMIITDVNERLVRSGTDNKVSPMKTVIQEVQLMSMATAYSAGGSPVVESYQFIARDFYYTEVDLGFIKNNLTTSEMEEPKTSQVNSENVYEIGATNHMFNTNNIAI
jgi:hypothetical protein